MWPRCLDGRDEWQDELEFELYVRRYLFFFLNVFSKTCTNSTTSRPEHDQRPRCHCQWTTSPTVMMGGMISYAYT